MILFMKIKSFFIVVLATLLGTVAYAKDEVTEQVVFIEDVENEKLSTQPMIDACIMLSDAVAANDTVAIRKAKDALKNCNIKAFPNLISQSKDGEESLNGHLVFNEAFADSLINGVDAYKYSDELNKTVVNLGRDPQRGDIPPNCYSKTILLKANAKSVYKFKTKGRTELSIVTGPGGLITTRAHVVNKEKGINQWHNDTTNVSKGERVRTKVFTVPKRPISEVTLEITNCSNKDVTAVVICN